MQHFMGLNMKKFFDPKVITFGDWGLETSFWQFRSKSLIKPKVQNPSFNFHKKYLNLGAWGPKAF